MLKFKSFLSEAIAPASLDKAAFIITKYLKRKTNMPIFRYPGIEEFKNNKIGKGFGLRFYFPLKNSSVRFNWHTTSIMGLAHLESITFWNGREAKPYQIDFAKSISLLKALPLLVDVIKTNSVGTDLLYTQPDDTPLEEAYIPSESRYLSEAVFEMPQIYDGVIDLIIDPTFTKQKIFSLYKSAGFKIFDELERRYPNLIAKNGVKYTWTGKDKDVKKLKSERQSVLDAIGVVVGKVSRGNETEKYTANAEVVGMENDIDRLTFEEQLKDLENLVRLTVAGASNALFVAGKGGVGKTHTTEKILASMGKTDGNGYFKNTGSASAAGIYSLLFKYKNDIVFFDDSDDALGDTEARNLFKAATDTKKIRKLVWNKMSKNLVDPDEMSDDDILAAGLLPKYFEFTGKIIFISNLPLQKLDPDGAIRTRAFVINIDPTEMEIYDFMEKIVDKMPLEDGLSLDSKARKHVVNLLRKTTSKQAPNLRKLSRGLNMAAGAIAAGVSVSDDDLQRMISQYA